MNPDLYSCLMEMRLAGRDGQYRTLGRATTVGEPSVPKACICAVPICIATILDDKSSFSTLINTGLIVQRSSGRRESPNIWRLQAVSARVGLCVESSRVYYADRVSSTSVCGSSAMVLYEVANWHETGGFRFVLAVEFVR